MEQKQRATVVADTTRFFDYARELGKSVYRRINQAAKLKEFIDLSIELREKLSQKAEILLQSDLTFRDQCNTIINSFSILNINIEKQKALAGDLMVIRGDRSEDAEAPDVQDPHALGIDPEGAWSLPGRFASGPMPSC